MTRLAIVMSSPGSASGGGAERVMARVANGLAGRGLDVDFLVHQPTDFWDEHIHPSVRLITFGKLNGALARVPVVRAFWWTSPIVAYVRRNRPDMVIGSLYFGHRCAVVTDLLFSGVKTAITINNNPRDVVTGQRSRYLRWLQDRTFRLAGRLDAVITIGDEMSARMVEAYPRTAHIINRIYDPHDLDDIRAKARESVDHPWLAPDREMPVVVTVGRLQRQKDIQTLVRATASTPADMRLIAVGEGQQLPMLLELADDLGIGDRVDFVGYQPNPYPYMANADVYALSSIHEGLCGTLIEALALGTPIVSTDHPTGAREILEDGRLGRLVPVGDHVAMGEALAAEIASPVATPADKTRSAERFSADAIIDQYEELVKRLCTDRVARAQSSGR